MTSNEKSLWFLITMIGFAVIWLWLRNSKSGQNIINQISEAFNMPGLTSPVIDLGEANDYNIPEYKSASFPDTEDNVKYNGCSMCGEKTIDIVYPAPVTVVKTNNIYIPTPPKKQKTLWGIFETKPKKPIYSISGQFVGYY